MIYFHFDLLIRSHFCSLAAVFFAAASTLSDFLLLVDTIHIMNLRVTFNRIAAIAALASPSLFAPGVFGVDPSVESVRIDPETGALVSAGFVCGAINSSKCNTGGEDYSTISKTLSDAPLKGDGKDMQALVNLRKFVQGKCKYCVKECDLKDLCEARKPILKAIRDHTDKDYPDTARSFCGTGELSCGRIPIADCNTGGEKYGLIKKTLLQAPKTGGSKAQNAIANLKTFFVDKTCANCINDSTTEELCRDSDEIVQGIRDYDDANYVSGLGPYCKEDGVADPANCVNPVPPPLIVLPPGRPGGF